MLLVSGSPFFHQERVVFVYPWCIRLVGYYSLHIHQHPPRDRPESRMNSSSVMLTAEQITFLLPRFLPTSNTHHAFV